MLETMKFLDKYAASCERPLSAWQNLDVNL